MIPILSTYGLYVQLYRQIIDRQIIGYDEASDPCFQRLTVFAAFELSKPLAFPFSLKKKDNDQRYEGSV